MATVTVTEKAYLRDCNGRLVAWLLSDICIEAQ